LNGYCVVQAEALGLATLGLMQHLKRADVSRAELRTAADEVGGAEGLNDDAGSLDLGAEARERA
jgi:hypothetical protein